MKIPSECYSANSLVFLIIITNIIVKDNRIAKIKGVTKLTGKNVTATDLRGGASMLICGLIAEGITTIDNVKYILRGYDDICGKLSKVGAKIELI